MARKLKTFETSLGFFDLAIAAPSMKAALDAWGADSNLFHQGVARESTDPDVIAATLAKPGVILKRPVGTHGPFRQEAELPASLARGDSDRPKNTRATPRKGRRKANKQPLRATDDKAARKAALAFEKEQKRRERERQKEEAASEKARERRQQAVAHAQAALDAAEREHDKRATAIDAEREAVETKAQAEDARWEKQKAKLQHALRLARE
jgi:colicin import membrane protein